MNRTPKISIVIPTAYQDKQREANLQQLIADIWAQSLVAGEIIIVRGSRPRTKAHNQGVKAASGELIVFFDDDVRLGSPEIVKAMAEAFIGDSQLGIVGVRIVPARDSGRFQQACAKQLLRAHNMVAHAALAIPKSLYEAVGGEDESLRLNDDAQLNFKIRAKKYQTSLLPPQFFIYHPEPANLWILLKKYFAQGSNQAHDYKTNPDMIFNAPISEQGEIKKSSVSGQLFRNLKILGQSLVTLKWLLILSRMATGLGFLVGYFNKISPVSVKGEVEIIKR